MPETPETHKEIVEIKKEVREIRQTQDAQIYHDRDKWEALLDNVLDDDSKLMQILLAVDGTRSAKDIEKECAMPQKSCWNRLNRLEREGIIAKAEETKKGSPVFVKPRWYKILRLDDKVQKKYSSLTAPTSAEPVTMAEPSALVQEDQNAAKQPS